MLKRIIPVLFMLLAGCTFSVSPTGNPQAQTNSNLKENISIVRESVNEMPQVIIWNNFGMYSAGARDWLTVASQRFHDPIVFNCHGGVHIENCQMPDGSPGTKREWWVYPDAPRTPMPVEKLAETLSNLYPDRDIILITCNPGAFDLHVKRVWYSKQVVWTVPSAFASGDYFRANDNDAVGSIWQFVSYDGRTGETPAMVADPRVVTPTTQPAHVDADEDDSL